MHHNPIYCRISHIWSSVTKRQWKQSHTYRFCFSRFSTFFCRWKFWAVQTFTRFSSPSMYSIFLLRLSLAEILLRIFLRTPFRTLSSSLVSGMLVGSSTPWRANSSFSSSDSLSSGYCGQKPKSYQIRGSHCSLTTLVNNFLFFYCQGPGYTKL